MGRSCINLSILCIKSSIGDFFDYWILNLERYEDGGSFMILENSLEKWLWSAKPHS